MSKQIINSCGLKYLKTLPDNSVDLFFTDPPYALGSEVIIRQDGKPDYKKAVDFMNKWNQPDGMFWEEWFKQAFRVLKYGGRVIMFGMDRQSWFNAYYAQLNGFQKQQSLYWYFISNFPKSADLSKNIDKNAGVERDVVGYNDYTNQDIRGGGYESDKAKEKDRLPSEITAPSTDLAKKYDGYKYSVSPLKQTVEEIAVFQKPYKTGSCLHDTLAYEGGDKECLCGALDINGGRVPTEEDLSKNYNSIRKSDDEMGERVGRMGFRQGKDSVCYTPAGQELGRYPSQTFCDTEAAKVLDGQSGMKCGQQGAITGNEPSFNKDVNLYGDWSNQGKLSEPRNDAGGCSKILHKCDYDSEDMDLYIYCPKVSMSERNAGCEGLEEKQSANLPMRSANIESENTANDGTKTIRTTTSFNNHPTVKPISLLVKVLSLFKTPNPQLVVDTFAGSGSIGIACEKLGVDYILVEQTKEYCDISELRTAYWANQFKKDLANKNNQISLELDF